MQGDESKFPAPQDADVLAQEAARAVRCQIAGNRGDYATGGRMSFTEAATRIRQALGGAR
ncbi:MAG: hypothetical protein WCB92_26580 [Mycobacterium sp.]